MSAFCNAGFALFSDSLTAFRGDVAINAVIATLVFLGGIGFPVLRAGGRRLLGRFQRWMLRRGKPPQLLPLDIKVPLATSALLLIGGAGAFAALELQGVLSTVSAGDGVLASFFTSVSARTAGFSTIDLASLDGATMLVLMGLMFVGGSPGSCAGGIKTTTFAVVVATMRAELVGRDPQIGGREISAGTIRRAIAVISLSAAIVFVCTLALSVSEDLPFLAVAFESVSAFATVGLSTGITPQLGATAKLILVLTMFIGRVGPLTIALAVSRRRPVRYRLAQEDLHIG